MTHHLLIVTADHNDGDYITQETIVYPNGDHPESKDYDPEYGNYHIEVWKVIQKLAKCLNQYNTESKGLYNRHNWHEEARKEEEQPWTVYKDQLTEDDFEYIREIVPNHEGGIHSIISMELLEVNKSTSLI